MDISCTYVVPKKKPFKVFDLKGLIFLVEWGGEMSNFYVEDLERFGSIRLENV